MQTILGFSALIITLAIFIILLLVEAVLHNRRLKSIPARITITGTRGKTSTARILASILRESGRSVLAKTTGSEAMYIFPNGSERLIKRIGPANILEQKKLVKLAAALKVDCLVAEQMSIQPENHWIESHKLLKPHYTILTNLRPDHLDAAGDRGMLDLYLNDLIDGTSVFYPEFESNSLLEHALAKKKLKQIPVKGSQTGINRFLAASLAGELGCDGFQIQEGIRKYHMDRGGLSAYKFDNKGIPCIFINAFAANDPFSSSIIINELRQSEKFIDHGTAGLLSFRGDRGERSLQWRDYLKNEGSGIFDQLFFLDRHGRIIKRYTGRGDFLAGKDPAAITEMITKNCNRPFLIFGLVNIGGMGTRLVNYWETEGEKIHIGEI